MRVAATELRLDGITLPPSAQRAISTISANKGWEVCAGVRMARATSSTEHGSASRKARTASRLRAVPFPQAVQA